MIYLAVSKQRMDFKAIKKEIPLLLISGMHLTELNTSGWICLLTVGIVHTGITYCMYFSALKDLAGQEAAILSYIDPLVAGLFSPDQIARV